jgi:MHS family proline/betaine transporter-like MFS transporter
LSQFSVLIESDVPYRRWQAVIAIAIGNALEWYDFVIFGFFAITIAKQFFPIYSPTSALLLSLATFGAAFVMRPVGAIVLGHHADRRGRKSALTLTISLMMIGTALIAFAPTYASVGLLAPFIVLVGRLMQGFSAGGEFGSATALLAEQNPQSRGFLGSWQFVGQALALVLAMSFSTGLVMVLEAKQIDAWGWRIPFVLGLLIGPVALYIRRRISESYEFQAIRVSHSPPREILSSFKSRTLIAFGLVTVATVAVYTLVFMPTFAVRYFGYSLLDCFTISLLAGIVQMILIPVAGALSDKWGRLPIAGIAALAILAAAIPLLTRVTSAPTFLNLLIFQIGIGALLAIYLGTLPAMMSELFPTQVRTIGLSVSYAFAVAAFGGSAPFINAYLINLSGAHAVPSYYLAVAALVSLTALIAARNFGLR